jgi:hypothetical protein
MPEMICGVATDLRDALLVADKNSADRRSNPPTGEADIPQLLGNGHSGLHA